MEIQILHIALDDSKFKEGAQRFFQTDSLKNHWHYYQYDNPISKIPPGWTGNEFDLCIVHFYQPKLIGHLRDLNPSCGIHVQFWGGDYVGQSSLPHLSDLTSKNFIHAHSRWRHFPHSLVTTGRRIMSTLHPDENQQKFWKSLEKVNSFSLLLREYELPFFPAYASSKMTGWNVNYGAFTTKQKPKSHNRKPNRVWLGNSATPSNNHLDALAILEQLNQCYETCIMPLSYGSDEYQKWIKEAAINRLGTKAYFVEDMIPLTEYNELLNSCQFIIMPHTRQQGLGNILQAIASGKTIYLNENGANFGFFTKKKINVKSLAQLKSEGLMELPIDDRKSNALRIQTIWESHCNQEGMIAFVREIAMKNKSVISATRY